MLGFTERIFFTRPSSAYKNLLHFIISWLLHCFAKKYCFIMLLMKKIERFTMKFDYLNSYLNLKKLFEK